MNESFELFTNCPQTTSQINTSLPWFNPIFSFGSSDYFNSCSSSFLVDVPLNSWGYQQARSGVGYSGLYTYVKNSKFREYIEEKISIPLQARRKYCVSFYLNLADSSTVATSSIGACITKDSLNGTNSSDTLPCVPNVQNNSAFFIDDTSNWIMFFDQFIATGGEQFITIGNFMSDIKTPTKNVRNGAISYSYYYIDDVSVYQLIEANAGSDKQMCIGQNATLGDSILPNTSYNWQPAAGLSDATAAMPIASPILTTTYTLNLSYTGPNCTGKMADTVTVFVDDCPHIYVGNVFSPNNDGKNDVLKIEGSGIKNVYMGIYDRWGNRVFETYDQIHSWDGTQRGNPCDEGVYMYYLRGSFTDGKLVEQKGNITLIK